MDDNESSAEVGDPLDPHELGLDGRDVRLLEDGRYVISTDEDDTASEETTAEPSSGTSHSDGHFPRHTLDELTGRYALVARARTEAGGEEALRVDSNSVAESFEALVRWYADCVAPEVPTAEAVATLLASTDIDTSTAGD
jgi:hypothetical protein